MWGLKDIQERSLRKDAVELHYRKCRIQHLAGPIQQTKSQQIWLFLFNQFLGSAKLNCQSTPLIRYIKSAASVAAELVIPIGKSDYAQGIYKLSTLIISTLTYELANQCKINHFRAQVLQVILYIVSRGALLQHHPYWLWVGQLTQQVLYNLMTVDTTERLKHFMLHLGGKSQRLEVLFRQHQLTTEGVDGFV